MNEIRLKPSRYRPSSSLEQVRAMMTPVKKLVTLATADRPRK